MPTNAASFYVCRLREKLKRSQAMLLYSVHRVVQWTPVQERGKKAPGDS